MILKKIHIENFGKLKNVNFDLTEGLNEFYHENGFGKTTLSIFIKAMFYGMPPARENIKMERKKYMPWQKGDFGGFIEFEFEEILYRATRFFGKTPEGDSFELLNLQTNKTVDLKGQELGEVVFGIGKETFEMTAFFPQSNFSALSNQQISANILGLDKFKYDLANLNTAIDQIKKKIAELKRDKPKNEEIKNIKQMLEDVRLEISQFEDKLKNTNELIMASKDRLRILEQEVLNSKKQKELYDQILREKQRIQDELNSKQAQLNDLLNLSYKQEQEKNINQNLTKNSKNIKTFQILMIVFAILSISAGILLPVLKLSIIIVLSVTLPLLMVCCIGLTGFVMAKTRQQKDSQSFYDEKSKIQQQIQVLNQQIELLQKSLAGYDNLNQPIVDMEGSVSEQFYQEKLKLQTCVHDKDFICNKIETLNEKYDFVKNELENKEELSLTTDKKISLLTKTKDFLIQANENVSIRFVGPANQAIKEILTKFDIRNREFVVDTNFDIKEVTALGVKEKEYSSQGYQDILAFCVRLYFLREIYKKEKPFIVLDDTFVNFDDENVNRVKEIIKNLAKDYQIFYMCCNSRCRLK